MTENPTSLYTAWLGAVPDAFRMFAPFGATAAPASGDAADAQTAAEKTAAMPFPVDQIGKAVDMLGDMLTQAYHAYLPLLGADGLSANAVEALANSLSTSFKQLLAASDASALALAKLTEMQDSATSAGQLPPMLKDLVGGAGGSAAGASQLRLGLERTFGGLSDAFGLQPTRELEQAWRDIRLAVVARQRAQAEYLGLVVQAWMTGTRELLKDLQAMGERGERIESLLAFIRKWAKAVDGPLHDTMQSPRGLEVTARLLRAATGYREQLRKTVGMASEALLMPTRAEMDDAYREIQELKRELRRIRKQLPAATIEAEE